MMSTSTLAYRCGSPIGATYFDGRSAAGASVFLEFHGAELVARSEQKQELLRHRIDELQFVAGSARSEFFINLPGGGQLIIPYSDEMREVLSSFQPKRSRLLRSLEENLRFAAALSVAAVVLLIFLYAYGLPLAVRAATPLVPLAAKQQINSHILSILEGRMLSETQLETSEQEEIAQALEEILPSVNLHVAPELLVRRIHFDFAGKGDGVANALAILPGTVVVSDELYRLLEYDELQAVIAHELGHLYHDHGTKGLLRGSFLSLMSLFIFGPNPELLIAIGMGVAEMRYSRDQEREADAFAADLLMSLGKDPAALGRGLRRIEEHYGFEDDAALSQYISTHPITAERIRAIEERAVSSQ